MSRSCVASPSIGWASLQPFRHVHPPGPALTAVALIGGVSLAGLTSVRPYTPLPSRRPPTALVRISPMGFVIVEAGFSYLQWLSIISDSYIDDPIYFSTATNNDTLYHFPSYSPIAHTPIFIYSKDLILPPSKDLVTLSPIIKDLVLVDLSPICKWEYDGEPLDSGDEPQRRRSERIAAALTAREAASRTVSAPNAGSSRGRGLLVANGGRRSGSNGGGPGGGGSKIGSSSGLRGKKRGAGAAPPAPGPPSPPSIHTKEDDPDDDADNAGWIYLFFSCILFLLVVIGSALKFKQLPPRRRDEFDTDLMIAELLRGHPFMNITRLDVTAFILFFILCGPGSERRRLNMAHFLASHDTNTILRPEAVSVPAQHEDESIATADSTDTIKGVVAAIEDHTDADSLASEVAFYTDTDLSLSSVKTDEDFGLSAICGLPIQEPVGAANGSVTVDNSVSGWKGKDKEVAAVDEAAPRSASSSARVKRRPQVFENAVASSSKLSTTSSTFSRLYVSVYKHHRSHPRTLTVFVQADDPTRGFIHFNLPNYRLPNNRFMMVDFSRRNPPFFLRKEMSAVCERVVEGEGDA